MYTVHIQALCTKINNWQRPAFDQRTPAQNMPESHIGVECPQNEHLKCLFGVCSKTQFLSNVAPVMAEHEESLPCALVVSYVSSWERDLGRFHIRAIPAISCHFATIGPIVAWFSRKKHTTAVLNSQQTGKGTLSPWDSRHHGEITSGKNTHHLYGIML